MALLIVMFCLNEVYPELEENMNAPRSFDKRSIYLVLIVGFAVLLALALPLALRTAIAQGPLGVSVTASPAAVRVGDYLIYTIVVNNTGSAVAGAQVTDILPAEAAFASCSATLGACTGTSGTIWTGDIGANQSVTITYTIRVTAVPPSGLLTDRFTTSDGAWAEISVPLLADFGSSYKIPSSTTVNQNDLLTYTIVVQNTGAPATGVVVAETPPDGSVPVSCEVVGYGPCSALAGVIWTGDMAAGQTLTIIYVVRAVGGTMDWPLFNLFTVNGTPMATTETRLNPPTVVTPESPTPTDTPVPPTATRRPRRPQPTPTPMPETVTPVPTPSELPKTGGAAPPSALVIGLLVLVGWTLAGLLAYSRRNA